jgi:hypothetical protein
MMALDQWEGRLEPRMTGIDLIGELNLSWEETTQIAGLIRAFVRSQGTPSAIENLRQRYPCTLAATLVFQGLYGYQEGDFWSAICAATGIANYPNYHQDLGQAFESIVTKLGISHQFAGHRYVGAILGHGGIPASSLPDFFQFMLLPSVTRPDMAALSTHELIEEWLGRSARHFVDKPVLRFLEYGGQVAEDFVDRCRQMARDYGEDDQSPSAEELGLPEAVVGRYVEWHEHTSESRSARPTGPRLRRPRIVLQPWGLGVLSALPEQQIPVSQSQGEVHWEILVADETAQVPVRVRRVDLDLKTEPVNFPLQSPATSYCARLLLNGETVREWIYEGTNGASLLTFDPETGTLLSLRKHLSRQPLWLLHASRLTLWADPADPLLIRETLPQLPWGWDTWQGYELDLSRVNSLTLSGPGESHTYAIAESQVTQQPRLEGGSQVDLLAESVPLYVGAPPCLCIPWRHGETPDNNLSRWHIDLGYEWEADPARSFKAKLSDLDSLLRWHDDRVELPLAHSSLLGPAPIGHYRLRMRGPLGNASELRFRVTPKLCITGHEPVYLPDRHGAQPVSLLIETDSRNRLEFLQHETTFLLQRLSDGTDGSCYQVDVPPDRTDAPLRLIRELGPGRTLFIPLRVPIQRVRWLLSLDPRQLARQTWLSRPATAYLAELEQSPFPYLLVEAPKVDETSGALRLRFLDTDGMLLRDLEAPTPLRPSRFRRFDLRLVGDALRQSRSPLIRAELILPGEIGGTEHALPVLTLKQGISVREVVVALSQAGDSLQLDLSWQPEIPLKSRYVRFWPQSRPWHAPTGVQLPDNARRQYTANLPANALPAGKYLVEFTVRDPWLPDDASEPPATDAQNAVTQVLGDLEGRLRQLEEEVGQTDDCFSCRCEQLLIRRLLDDPQAAERDLQWCYEHIHEATVEQMMALAKELGNHPTAKAIQYKLYRPERMQQMLAAYSQGSITAAGLEFYLARMPSMALHSLQICTALLNVPDDRLRLAAGRELIQQSQMVGLEAVLAWAEQGLVSDAAALELLEVNVPFASKYFSVCAETNVTGRLWETLARAHPEQVAVICVRPGYWVRCQAGWGRIGRIEAADGHPVTLVRRDQIEQGYRLHITLRPGEDAEPAVLDTGLHVVQFLQAPRVYLCTTCSNCAARSDSMLYNKHKRAAHEGIVFGFRTETSPIQQGTPLEFAVARPTNVWT